MALRIEPGRFDHTDRPRQRGGGVADGDADAFLAHIQAHDSHASDFILALWKNCRGP